MNRIKTGMKASLLSTATFFDMSIPSSSLQHLWAHVHVQGKDQQHLFGVCDLAGTSFTANLDVVQKKEHPRMILWWSSSYWRCMSPPTFSQRSEKCQTCPTRICSQSIYFPCRWREWKITSKKIQAVNVAYMLMRERAINQNTNTTRVVDQDPYRKHLLLACPLDAA